MNIPEAQKPITRVYADFRGVDLSIDYTETALNRSPYMENFYIDYTDSAADGDDVDRGGLKSRPCLAEGTVIEGIKPFLSELKYSGNNFKVITRHNAAALVAIGPFLFFVPNFPAGLSALNDLTPTQISNYAASTITMFPKVIGGIVMLTSALIINVPDAYDTQYFDPAFVEYGDSFWFYTYERVDVTQATLRITETPTGNVFYTNVFKVKKDWLDSSAENFLNAFCEQETLTAGFATKATDGRRGLKYPKYEDEKSQETFAPVLFTDCTASGGGRPWLPRNLFAAHARIDYDCLELPDVLAGGITVPLDATHVSIRVYAPSADGAYQYVYFDLDPVGAADDEDTGYRKWMSAALKTKIKAMPKDGTGNVHFIARVLARVQPGSTDIDCLFDYATVYDERVFFLKQKSRQLRYAQAGNPCYLPDTAVQYDSFGDGDACAMLAFGKYLAVVQSGKKNCRIYLHAPQTTDDDLLTKVYPSVYSLPCTGAVNRNACLCVGDNALVLTYDGLKQIVSTDLKQEAFLAHRSSKVDKDLIPLLDSFGASAQLFRYKNYACIYVHGRLFLADTRALYSNPGTKTNEFEWFCWDTFRIRDFMQDFYLSHFEYDGNVLYAYGNNHLYTQDGVRFRLPVLHAFTGKSTDLFTVKIEAADAQNIPVNMWSILTTRFDNFGAYQAYKDMCRTWQTAAVAECGPALLTADDFDIYECPDALRYLSYWYQNSGQGQNPNVTLLRSKEKLSAQYIRYKDGKIRYKPRSRRFCECALAFVFKKPVRFLYATAQAYIRGVAKR